MESNRYGHAERRTLVAIGDVLGVGLDELVLGRDGKCSDGAVVDVRLPELIRELQNLDRRFREMAIAVIDAIVVQGNHEAVSSRLSKRH